ncbi:c-type cytochrome [Elongatibacter sediminis]|uniref:cytochrome-c oxidase n=1 Tax=Elongatibacter sediminis TaxID=3119006 RepID=A0AAW9RA69_9GAMM
MAIALGILVLVVVTVLFHFLSPWWFTPIAADWEFLDLTVDITFWLTGAVFIALNGFLIWVILKYRHREGLKAHYEPESKKLEWWLTIVTTIGVVALLAPGLWVWGKFVDVPDDAQPVEVVGQQWHWNYRFPGADGQLGQADIALVSPANPFGLKADDPAGQDDIVVNDAVLHLALGQPYKLVLRSRDVLHNFTVPQFRVKMDLVPGTTSYQWLKPTRTGQFDVLCEELCGIGHFAMRGAVVVDPPEDFQAWLDGHPTFAEFSGRAEPDVTAGRALYATCSACHGPGGEGNEMLNAPRLAGQQPEYLMRQLRNFKHGLRGASSDDPFGMQMAPMASTLRDDAAIANVVAYIDSLEVEAPAGTITGDTERGAKLFGTCASCHGKQGQGIWALNAPRLEGINDWYLKRQLQNYRQGIRGSHPQDLYGKQMNLLSGMLRDEQSMNDVVAYINSL